MSDLTALYDGGGLLIRGKIRPGLQLVGSGLALAVAHSVRRIKDRDTSADR